MQEPSQAAAQQVIAREFTFSGDADSMPSAREAVMDFVRPYFTSHSQEIDFLIALQEGLANAVFHGCGNDPAKTIYCLALIDCSAFTITIRDPGPGFDVEAVTQPGKAGANLTEHGKGICLMRSVMDEVAYRNGGSEVRLRKVRSASRQDC